MCSVQGHSFAVTGGSGFVGRRLVEMLVERGANRVVSLDIREPMTKSFPHMNMLTADQEKKVQYVLGDISNKQQVVDAFKGMDGVFHIAAAVGPFLPQPVFQKVNVIGTENVIHACKVNNIKYLVASSSPSIFFDGRSISGLAPKEMKIVKPGHFLATYAETKAVAEKLVREANDPPNFFTINVAPHQVYGPRDALFLPNFIAAKHSLRIFGNGQNRVSMTHVDNYSHGLILALDKLRPNSPVLGKFYLVTDGGSHNFWDIIDRAVVRNGAASLHSKFRVPTVIMYAIAYFGVFVGYLTGQKFRISPFNVTMLTIDRYFNIDDATRDLGYVPIKTFEEGWEETLAWYDKNPEFSQMCADTSIQGKLVNTNKKNE